jgi:DNA repair exonuclease SbcCD ATPase subunit
LHCSEFSSTQPEILDTDKTSPIAEANGVDQIKATLRDLPQALKRQNKEIESLKECIGRHDDEIQQMKTLHSFQVLMYQTYGLAAIESLIEEINSLRYRVTVLEVQGQNIPSSS